MIRFKIVIIIVDNGEQVKFGFADSNGNFYSFTSTCISNFDLAFFWEFSFQTIYLHYNTLSYDDLDKSYYVEYPIKESDEIILEEFVYI